MIKIRSSVRTWSVISCLRPLKIVVDIPPKAQVLIEVTISLSKKKKEMTAYSAPGSLLIFLTPVCLPACLSTCMSVCLSVCVSVCLPAFLSLCLSVYLLVCLPFCLSVCLPVCLSVSLPVCLSVCLSFCLSTLSFKKYQFNNKTVKQISLFFSNYVQLHSLALSFSH